MFILRPKQTFIKTLIIFVLCCFVSLNSVAQRFDKGCTPDRPIKDVNGNCFSCDYPNKIKLGNYWTNCQYYCGNKRTQGDSFTDCILVTQKSLKFKNPCPDGKFPDIGTNCYSCDTDEEVITTDINCMMCGDKRKMSGILSCIPAGKKCEKNQFMGIDGKCYSCDTSESVDIGKMPQNCSSCGTKRKIHGSSHCVLANKTCKTNEIMDEKGNCFPCDSTEIIYMHYKNDNCIKSCGNKRISDGRSCILKNCPSDKPLRDTFGKCHSCDTPDRIFVKDVESNCDICPQRTRHTERPTMYGNTYCLMANCPADKPLQDENKYCFPCDKPEGVFLGFGSKECPAACGDQRVFHHGYCYLQCPQNYFWYGRTDDGKSECISCDSRKQYTISEDAQIIAEQACGDKRVFLGNKFVLKCKQNEFMDDYGQCRPCDTNERFNVTDYPENCNACPNRTVHESNDSRIKFCMRNCLENEVKDIHGMCHSCDDVKFIRVQNPNDCNVCPNRHIRYGDRCTINKCPVGYYEREDNGQSLYYADSNCAPLYEPVSNAAKSAGMAVMWGLYGLSQE